jgi:hypothetical protein
MDWIARTWAAGIAVAGRAVSAALRRVRLAHLARAALALFILWAIRAPHILIVLGPPQQVVTTNPIVGVHTRLTDEVENWKIQRTLHMVREMGAPWVVEYFPGPTSSLQRTSSPGATAT